MKLKEYLLDKRHFFLFYFILMTFISAVIYLDHTVKVSISNILYIHFVSFVFLCIYIIVGYLFYKRYYENISEIIEKQDTNVLSALPTPINNEQRLYHNLLYKAYLEEEEKIKALQEEKRDNLEFITSWVHEVKTPIATSRLIIENSREPYDEVLNSLEEEVDKIEAHVERALYYSRIDAFSKDYFIHEIQLEKVIKDIIKKNAKTFISKGISFKMDNMDATVTTDKKWLSFIIDQILSNSLKYTDKEGSIKIYTQKDKKEKRLIIEDNGIGIKNEDLSRVFNKGFTGHIGRENYQSTGMGLYLAKKLSKKLGHDLTITSEFGKYTKVTIHFPKLIDYFNVSKL
ncbi:sensor histidine kinase [Crassaminicella profunda]|uniref:sensor histidine kinase n=1 Tax=Crassaminicella profunda TaxID=1286698 RepID=UPI001CA630C3|nr:sensor histidine kinase [Crassaminicella profunda]QZY55206.1 sensor histidine kinase [Crassaminicella profunda]